MGVVARVGMAGRIAISAGVGCVVFLGCATLPREPSPDDYLFFIRYPELKRLAAPSGVFLYGNPHKPVRDQDHFIVNPASIVFQPESAYWLDRSKSQELADLFRKEVIASLSEKYKVVETPVAGALRVSVNLADIRRRPSSGSPGSSRAEPQYQPVLIMLITDPTTGQAVVLLRDINRGNEFAAVAKSDEAAARRILSDWAKTLRARLDEARHAAARQPTSQP